MRAASNDSRTDLRLQLQSSVRLRGLDPARRGPRSRTLRSENAPGTSRHPPRSAGHHPVATALKRGCKVLEASFWPLHRGGGAGGVHDPEYSRRQSPRDTRERERGVVEACNQPHEPDGAVTPCHTCYMHHSAALGREPAHHAKPLLFEAVDAAVSMEVSALARRRAARMAITRAGNGQRRPSRSAGGYARWCALLQRTGQAHEQEPQAGRPGDDQKR